MDLSRTFLTTPGKIRIKLPETASRPGQQQHRVAVRPQICRHIVIVTWPPADRNKLRIVQKPFRRDQFQEVFTSPAQFLRKLPAIPWRMFPFREVKKSQQAQRDAVRPAAKITTLMVTASHVEKSSSPDQRNRILMTPPGPAQFRTAALPAKIFRHQPRRRIVYLRTDDEVITLVSISGILPIVPAPFAADDAIISRSRDFAEISDGSSVASHQLLSQYRFPDDLFPDGTEFKFFDRRSFHHRQLRGARQISRLIHIYPHFAVSFLSFSSRSRR